MGYIPQNGFAVTFGSPLCERDQIPRVAKAYLRELARRALKPVWCCVDKPTQTYLAAELGWSALAIAAEERIDPVTAYLSTIRRKVHRAARDGVRILDVDGAPAPDLQARIAARCAEWSAARRGAQIHLTSVRPFDDAVHRRYFYAMDKNGEVRPPRAINIIISVALMMRCPLPAVDMRARRPRAARSGTRLPDQMGTRVPRRATRHDRVHPCTRHPPPRRRGRARSDVWPRRGGPPAARR